jgi:hypothetical protein
MFQMPRYKIARVKTNWAKAGPIALLLVLSACSRGEKVEIAKVGVNRLHAEINATQFDEIFNGIPRVPEGDDGGTESKAVQCHSEETWCGGQLFS